MGTIEQALGRDDDGGRLHVPGRPEADHEQAFHRAEVGAAVALGPVRRGPATLVEDALPGHCVLLARRMAGTQAFADL